VEGGDRIAVITGGVIHTTHRAERHAKNAVQARDCIRPVQHNGGIGNLTVLIVPLEYDQGVGGITGGIEMLPSGLMVMPYAPSRWVGSR